MKLNQISFFNETNSNLTMDFILKSSVYGVNKVSNITKSDVDKSRPNIFQAAGNNPKKCNETSIENKREGRCLKVEVIKKMLFRFLLEKKMKQEELAKVLNITTKELEKFLSHENVNVGLINKVNLPLIKLYCATRWLQK